MIKDLHQYELIRQSLIMLCQKIDHDTGANFAALVRKVIRHKTGEISFAVTGEVSSGKSTFINALLGEEILPASVLQCTSAVVRIFHSEDKMIHIKFADGGEQTISDFQLDDIRAQLCKLASIDERYRGIPTASIDVLLSN
jgi:hypothetical protein